MISLRNFRFLNPEWFRKPLSRIEETLRIPVLIKNGAVILVSRILLPWLLFTLLVWWLTGGITLAALGPVIILISELLVLKRWYEKRILKQHLKNIKLIKTIFKKKSLSIKELRNDIKQAVGLAGWGLVRIAYVGLASWGWEIIFRTLYPLLTNTQIDYRDLLIGFKNKGIETDQALWEVAQEKNKQKEKLRKYLNEYGSRVEDIDLAYPTFRENKKAVNSMIKLYARISSPISSLNKAKKKRIDSTKEVLKDLRMPQSIFRYLLKTVQTNVRLREDRRFYNFIADYYLRQMIISLGAKLKLDKKEVFNKSWKELKDANN